MLTFLTTGHIRSVQTFTGMHLKLLSGTKSIANSMQMTLGGPSVVSPHVCEGLMCSPSIRTVTVFPSSPKSAVSVQSLGFTSFRSVFHGLVVVQYFSLASLLFGLRLCRNHSNNWRTWIASVDWHFTLHPSFSCNIKLKREAYISMWCQKTSANHTNNSDGLCVFRLICFIRFLCSTVSLWNSLSLWFALGDVTIKTNELFSACYCRTWWWLLLVTPCTAFHFQSDKTNKKKISKTAAVVCGITGYFWLQHVGVFMWKTASISSAHLFPFSRTNYRKL